MEVNNHINVPVDPELAKSMAQQINEQLAAGSHTHTHTFSSGDLASHSHSINGNYNLNNLDPSYHQKNTTPQFRPTSPPITAVPQTYSTGQQFDFKDFFDADDVIEKVISGEVTMEEAVEVIRDRIEAALDAKLERLRKLEQEYEKEEQEANRLSEALGKSQSALAALEKVELEESSEEN